MELKKYIIDYYEDDDGNKPFIEWLESIKDKVTKHRIQARLDRVAVGNFGDCEPIGNGLSELRLDFGPGYRIYYGQDGLKVILLLCGGDKSTQQKDIKKAKKYWENYFGE